MFLVLTFIVSVITPLLPIVTDYNIPLGVVKSKYTIVQNNDAFNFFDDAIGKNSAIWQTDRKSTRLNSSHSAKSRVPSSA